MKKRIAIILVILLALGALSVSASADTLSTGRILVTLNQTDTPLSAGDLLPDFETENGDTVYGEKEFGCLFVLKLVDHRTSAIKEAVEILRKHPGVSSACSEEDAASHYAPGQVMVMPKTKAEDPEKLFEDFCVESIREIVKSTYDNPPVYLVKFEEKSPGIVLDAIDALATRVRFIEPDWITYDDAETDPIIYFDANRTVWENADQIYCHIWEYNGDNFFEWQTTREKCDKVNDDGLWSYNLEKYGITLEDEKKYCVVFSCVKFDTYSLFFDNSCFGDTAYVTGEIVENIYDPKRPGSYLACWTTGDPDSCGPVLTVTSTGNVIGSVCPPGLTTNEIMKNRLSDHRWLENVRSVTGKSDQEIVDQLKQGLSLEDYDVEIILLDITEPIDWIPQRKIPVPEPNEKASEILKESLRSYPYNRVICVYIEYADDIRLAPPDTDDPQAINRYHTDLEEREKRLFDELFNGIYASVQVCGMSNGVIANVDACNIAQIAENDFVKSIDLSYNFGNPQLRGYVGPGCRFAKEFEKQYEPYQKTVFKNSCAKYDEVRYHVDENGVIDWAIVSYVPFSAITDSVTEDYILCDKHIYLPGPYSPFTYGYGLYDAKKKTFIDLDYLYLFDEYEGLEEAFRSLDLSYLSPRVQLSHQIWGTVTDEIKGDADGDGKVTVLDATKIQKCKAGLASRYMLMTQNADADSDGIVTVLDATRIQKYKAGICDLDGNSHW